MKTILLSAAVSMFVALFGTPLAIKAFTRRGYGQEIRSDGPAGHLSKRGTPTMGGTVIIIASLGGYLIGHLVTGNPMSASGLLVLAYGLNRYRRHGLTQALVSDVLQFALFAGVSSHRRSSAVAYCSIASRSSACSSAPF